MLLFECRRCQQIISCRQFFGKFYIERQCSDCVMKPTCFIGIFWFAKHLVKTLANNTRLCANCVQILLNGKESDDGQEQQEKTQADLL